MSRVRPLLLACAASYLNHSINDKEMRSLCLANKKGKYFHGTNHTLLEIFVLPPPFSLFTNVLAHFCFAADKFLPANNLAWHSYCVAPESVLNLVCRIVYQFTSVDVSVQCSL